MTEYTFYDGEIMKDDVKVGWLSDDLNHLFECVSSVKIVLESHGHVFDVKYFRKGFESVPVAPYMRIVEGGIYITDHEDDMNYAFFSNDMNAPKLCAKTVLEVMIA